MMALLRDLRRGLELISPVNYVEGVRKLDGFRIRRKKIVLSNVHVGLEGVKWNPPHWEFLERLGNHLPHDHGHVALKKGS